MAVNLTESAISIMCGDDFNPDSFNPVLQVMDLKLVQTQQQSSSERYRLVVSDGTNYQQGMLATQKNELVHAGRLKKGSIVKLTQFICNVVQNRKIIIIIELDVVLNECDLIGNPVPFSRSGYAQSATGQPGTTSGNPQSLNSNSHPGSIAARPNEPVPSLDPPKVSYPTTSGYGASNAPPMSFKTEHGSVPRSAPSNAPPMGFKTEHGSVPRSAPFSGSYGDQNTSFRNPQFEASRPFQNSHARSPQPMNQQPSPMFNNRGPMGRNEAPPRIIPISALNPYQSAWTIKARVTAKGELRHYSNARGDGKVFSFDLLDSDGGEIRATCFNAVADQFYNVVEAGKIYHISRGSVKPAQKNFNHLRNDQELTLDISSVIQPCLEDDSSIPKQTFNFRPICEVETTESNSILDVIGVVSSISPTSSIMRKNGTETQKRTLQLKDMSARSVELTLWGNFCNAEGQRLQSMCDSGAFPVLAAKAVRVNDFNGKSVGTIATSQLFVNPEFEEAYKLKEWFDREGRSVPTISISREASSFAKTDGRKTISQIKDEKLGTSEKPDWISVSASISFIKVDNFCYTACPIMIGERKCSKKVTNNGDGKWRCDRCDQSVDACDYRYMLQFQIQDHTGMTWVTGFQESGEEIMGMPAQDLYFLKYEDQDDEKFAEVIRKVLFSKYMFKLKVKEETFNDEQRVKSTVVKAEKVNYASESKFLLDLIDKLNAAEDVNPSSLINNAGPGSVGTGQAVPPVYNPVVSSANANRDYGMPPNQANQYGNQYSNSYDSAGATGSYMSCNNCGGSGHSFAQCPKNMMNQPVQSAGGGYSNRASAGSGGGASGECFKCKQTGHWARDCPGFSAAPPAYGINSGSVGSGGASGECYKCHQTGHWARDCPGAAPPQTYGNNNNGMQGRYGVQRQQFGGY